MLKTAKITLAAALVAGSCGLAFAQAGGGGGAGGDRQPSTEAHPGGNPTSPGNPNAGPAMKQKDTGMQTPTPSRGAETGTAPDSASPGAMRKAPGTNNTK